ncbi:MAG TPA: hypothetical protein VHR41_18970 [Gemmatimonadales bacterium]|nr:hypothetical protein [Gemmatimonadales bacterium]
MYRLLPPLSAALALAGCTGLAAGPEVSTTSPAPVSRDSAYVRAKRAAQAEGFTLDVQDSLRGRLSGLRYPSANARVGTAAACRVQLALALQGGPDRTDIGWKSRWIAPTEMASTKSGVCETDRTETLARIEQVITPPQQ